MLVNVPNVPASFVMVASAVVGLVVVLQQTPLAVMVEPPSLVIFPPLVAVVALMKDATVVVNSGVATLAAPPTKFVHAVPLYTCTSPEVPQLLHQIIKLAVGETIAFRCTDVILGGKNPFEVLVTSNSAEDTGVVVPMPTWAITLVEHPKIRATRTSFKLIIIYLFFLIFNTTHGHTICWTIRSITHSITAKTGAKVNHKRTVIT